MFALRGNTEQAIGAMAGGRDNHTLCESSGRTFKLCSSTQYKILPTPNEGSITEGITSTAVWGTRGRGIVYGGTKGRGINGPTVDFFLIGLELDHGWFQCELIAPHSHCSRSAGGL